MHFDRFVDRRTLACDGGAAQDSGTFMLRRRTLQLGRSFQLVAATLGVPALWLACSSAATNSNPPPGSYTLPDGSVVTPGNGTAGNANGGATGGGNGGGGTSTGGGDDSGLVVGADSSTDLDATACWATVTLLDAGPEAGPDAEEPCDYLVPCGLDNEGLAPVNGCQVVPTGPDGGPVDPATIGFPYCQLVDGRGCSDGGYAPTDSGGVEFVCAICPGGGGRRPGGHVREMARGWTEAGAYFAEMAALEAASVRAFDDLARELAAHGAPEELVLAARASARDEVRHARAMRALASRHGGSVRPAQAKRLGRRTLAAIAKENAVEGCVRETFGALVNAWQAAHAEDASVRAAMAEIARDELRHAALSWEIAAWAETKLGERDRREIARAKRKAVARVVRDAQHEGGSGLRGLAGLPSANVARELARGLATELWS
jgi:hypothetical protein